MEVKPVSAPRVRCRHVSVFPREQQVHSDPRHYIKAVPDSLQGRPLMCPEHLQRLAGSVGSALRCTKDFVMRVTPAQEERRSPWSQENIRALAYLGNVVQKPRPLPLRQRHGKARVLGTLQKRRRGCPSKRRLHWAAIRWWGCPSPHHLGKILPNDEKRVGAPLATPAPQDLGRLPRS